MSVRWLVSLTQPRPRSWPWCSLLSPRIPDLTQPLGETPLSSHSLPLGHPDPRRGSWESGTLVSPNHRARQTPGQWKPWPAHRSLEERGPVCFQLIWLDVPLGPVWKTNQHKSGHTCPARGSYADTSRGVGSHGARAACLAV